MPGPTVRSNTRERISAATSAGAPHPVASMYASSTDTPMM